MHENQNVHPPEYTEAKVRLYVDAQDTDDGRAAIKLLKERFNGSLHVTRIEPADGEVLPQLWETGVCYYGLEDIRRYMKFSCKASGASA